MFMLSAFIKISFVNQVTKSGIKADKQTEFITFQRSVKNLLPYETCLTSLWNSVTMSKAAFSWCVVCLRSNSSEELERESNSESNGGWTLSLFISIFISISNFQIAEAYKEESVCFLISLLQCLCRGMSHWWALQAGGSQNWDREKGSDPVPHVSKVVFNPNLSPLQQVFFSTGHSALCE